MPSSRNPLPQALKTRGVSRRDFVKFCKLMVATLALPPRYLSAVEKALSSDDASRTGLARISGLRGQFGIDAPDEQPNMSLSSC